MTAHELLELIWAPGWLGGFLGLFSVGVIAGRAVTR